MSTVETFPTVRLAVYLFGHINVAKVKLDQFKAHFAENPAHTLAGSGAAFEAAAILQTYGNLLRILRHDPLTGKPTADAAKDMEEATTLYTKVMDHVNRSMLQAAQTIMWKSTSTTSNLMDEAVLQAYAKLLEFNIDR